jgi:hypothetical protein
VHRTGCDSGGMTRKVADQTKNRLTIELMDTTGATMTPDLLIFNILIPCTENATGIVHAPEKFDQWLLKTVDRFGGATVIGIGLRGLWFDEDLPRDANPIEDHSNWYKIGVEPRRVDELREYVRETGRHFGQKCLYFERAGEAEFIWAS